MEVTRIEAAGAYPAPGHFDVRTLRLQGADATPVKNFTVGLSVFLPAGGCEMATTPLGESSSRTNASRGDIIALHSLSARGTSS